MTLFDAYLNGNHRPMHKWYQYFPAYEKHFERFRNRHVTLFEIGIGQGGSLQLWKAYLGPFARIVGLDVYPMCKQCEEDQVSVRIGSQDDLGFLASVIDEFGPPDIVIDDGSHLQPDIRATFDFLYPRVAKNGVYLVEDLHAAYWPDHGGGVGADGSFIEIAKDCVDAMHAEYSLGALPRSPLGDRTTSIHFYDSVVVMEVGESRPKGNRTTGDAGLFNTRWVPPGETPESFAVIIQDAVAALRTPGPDLIPPPPSGRRPAYHAEPTLPPVVPDPKELRIMADEITAARRQIGELEDRLREVETGIAEGLGTMTAEIVAARQQIGERDDRLRVLETEISVVRGSTSWRVTAPLRAIGRLLGK